MLFAPAAAGSLCRNEQPGRAFDQSGRFGRGLRGRRHRPRHGDDQQGGKFTGNFAISQFQVAGDQIVAVGTLTGTIQNSVGNVISTILKSVQMSVAIKAASCDIRHLELGPLADIVGLLNQILALL